MIGLFRKLLRGLYWITDLVARFVARLMGWMLRPIVWKSLALTATFVLGVYELQKWPQAVGWVAYFFSFLPDLTGYFFAMAGVALLFMQDDLKKLEPYRFARLCIAGVIFLIGLGAVVANTAQKQHESKAALDQRNVLMSQIGTLISSAQVQATKDDVLSINRTLSVGLTDMSNAIAGSKSKLSLLQPERSVPTVENTRLVQRPTVSDDPQFPYGLQVIVQSNVTLDPVALGFECDGEVGKVKAFIAGQGAYMNVSIGPADQNNHIAVVKFGFPPLRPETPLVVTILSKTQVKVIRGLKLQ